MASGIARHLRLDCSAIEPQVTWGIDPAHVIGLSGHIPDPDDAPEAERANLRRALDYMRLEPGMAIAGVAVDRVFIGSCTNACLSDLQAAAAVVAGRHVAPGLRATVVPGSTVVKRQAEARGLRRVFLDAGFEWGEAGCLMCAGVMTHLASPETTAAALAGRLVNRRATP